MDIVRRVSGDPMTMYFVAGAVALGVFAFGFLVALVLRMVVPTNEELVIARDTRDIVAK